MEFELSNPSEITNLMLKDIEQYAVDNYRKDFNRRLGASEIAHKCSRYLFYKFRWFQKSKTDGRTLRLMKRGDLEELRFAEYLKGIGCQLWTHADDGEQYKMSGVHGHFGGALDGIAILPQKFGISDALLVECKTNGTGAGFTKLCTVGMQQAKEEHFVQNSIYGFKYGFTHCLYSNTNKNDDSMHLEIVKLDWELAKKMEAKAEFIIMSEVPPPKASQKPDSVVCNYCQMKGVCHEGAKPEINCRSCKNSKPVENTQWFCKVHESNIPDHIIKTGCDKYDAIA